MRPEASPLPGVDVLVLGAGLAGLRAAWAALEAAPRAVVAVAAPARGPSGSSFANVNDRLGLHAPIDDRDRAAFCREALRLGHPGLVCTGLVKILAEEALNRRRELEALGLDFVPGDNGAPRRFGSCFSPTSERAVVFTGLASAHAAVSGRVAALGARFLPGMTGLELLHDRQGGRVLGALLEDRSGRLHVQPARAVVAAMGGAASLFRFNQAGRGGTGYGHGILVAAGATMANTAFLQWMWTRRADRRFWPIWSLLDGRAVPLGPPGRPVAIPETVRLAAASRQTHCPLGHGLADAALDLFLLDLADDMGVATVRSLAPTGRPDTFRVVLAAHAGNGGAVVDAWGRTDVPGLFAAGECATGMHGANRIGGAMVAACLVFGARAGRAAVAGDHDAAPGKNDLAAALARTMHKLRRDPRERAETRRWLADVLQRHGLPGGKRDAGNLEPLVTDRLRTAADPGAGRMLQTAQCFARGRSFPSPAETA